MEKREISQDDITDTLEMRDKIIDFITELFDEVPLDIALSAMINSMIPIIVDQFETKEGAFNICNYFVEKFQENIEEKNFDID